MDKKEKVETNASISGGWVRLPADYGDVLRRAAESLFKTFEHSSVGTLIVDKDARVVWINQRYAARFGFADPQQAIGRDCEAVIPHSLMREVVATGRPILLDIMETGREPLVVTRLPLTDDAGETVGAIGFALFDELKTLTPLFSRYMQVQQELIATQRSLAQARRAKYTFASFVGTSAVSLETKRQGGAPRRSIRRCCCSARRAPVRSCSRMRSTRRPRGH